MLNDSEEVRRCFALQWTRFAFKRDLERADEGPFAAIVDRFARSKYDIRELLIAIAGSKSFLNRAVAPGEVSP
jgi:hypothetical protein